jgi:hypothetical protein
MKYQSIRLELSHAFCSLRGQKGFCANESQEAALQAGTCISSKSTYLVPPSSVRPCTLVMTHLRCVTDEQKRFRVDCILPYRSLPIRLAHCGSVRKCKTLFEGASLTILPSAAEYHFTFLSMAYRRANDEPSFQYF